MGGWERERMRERERGSILTPGQPVPALTLKRQGPGRVASSVPIFKWPERLDLENAPWAKRVSIPGLSLVRSGPYPLTAEAVYRGNVNAKGQ